FGGDALLDLAVAGWTHQQRKIRACMHVDEAWAHHTTGRVDASRCLDRRRKVTQGDDAVALYADVSSITPPTSAIAHQSAHNNQGHAADSSSFSYGTLAGTSAQPRRRHRSPGCLVVACRSHGRNAGRPARYRGGQWPDGAACRERRHNQLWGYARALNG